MPTLNYYDLGYKTPSLLTWPGKGYSTRELLTKLGAYGYGHKLLLRAHKIGLVERKNVRNKVVNSLTNDGKKIVTIAKEIGV